MPAKAGESYPPSDTVIAYLAAYEARYALPVRRPVRVAAIQADGPSLRAEMTDGATWEVRAIISATGTWSLSRSRTNLTNLMKRLHVTISR